MDVSLKRATSVAGAHWCPTASRTVFDNLDNLSQGLLWLEVPYGLNLVPFPSVPSVGSRSKVLSL